MKRFLWIGILVLVLGGYAGFQQYSSWSLSKPQDTSITESGEGAGRGSGNRRQGQGQGRRGGRSREAVPVLIATAMQKSTPIQIRAVGTAEPFATVAVKSQVTGVLVKAHFQEGHDVKKGQLLFTIDPRPFEAAVKQAEANLARDTAQLRNMREQARRYAELVEKQYVSREQYDQIRTNADAMEAVVDADKAAVENAKVQLSYCYIYSPMVGRAGSLLVNEGNLVRVNDGTPLVVINQVTPINVTFAVPEQHLAELTRRSAASKLAVSATFPSDEGRPEQGKLEFLDNVVDRSTGTIKLKAVFANNERRLWPGQFINVAVTLSTQGDAVVIPSEAVQVGQEGQHVFVVKPDNRVELRPVTIARTSDGEAVIAQGLAVGEQVVREGQFLLGPDSRIEIKDPTRVADEIKGEGRKGRAGKGKGKPEAKRGD
ncbi:MAG: efflux RND transporter periplasmic adaptor subunit, partial [Deltaproteobacteria bacterium]|nr:efflux RND transporter periplasmic adaptor subunit [Deltaproteobacteria bacterium]